MQCARPSTETRIQLNRGLAGVTDRALDLLEIARREIMPLLQIDALGSGFALGVRRDRVELGREPGDEIGQLALATADLLKLRDQGAALLVGLFEQSAESEREAARTILRQCLHERRNLGRPLLEISREQT